MTRRIVLAAVVLGVVGGVAGTASASDNAGRHGVCIVVMNDPSQPNRDGVCVDLFPYVEDTLSK